MTAVRAFLILLVAVGAACSMPRRSTPASTADFELAEASLQDLQAGLAAGRYTSRQLTERYLQRIADIDTSGPSLHSVITTNPDALTIAETLDAERRDGRVRGPLHGIPVLLKDNISTADKMATTAGSLALQGSVAPADAFIVARLREAGAVILGKTNLSEWANFRSSKSTSGWSAVGGFVRNPYVLDRNPCGSSSGTGAAIAASLAAVGVGTETDGSIVCPSSVSALVGLKPTVGLLSRSGIVPISHSQDTAGPMARTVADAAMVLAAMVGHDPQDAAMAGAPPVDAESFTRALDAPALPGARIGVARGSYVGYSAAADRLFQAALDDLKAQGAILVDPIELPPSNAFDACEIEVLLYEFKADLNAYLAALGARARVRSLGELIAFNEREQVREMSYFGQELFVRANAKGPLTDPAYTEALETCRTTARENGIDSAVTTHQLDAIVALTMAPAWTTDVINGDHVLGGSSTLAAVAGYPSITVPAGFVRELPVGISFIGPAWSEARLIGLAHAYEQATKHRRQPRFLPTLGLE